MPLPKQDLEKLYEPEPNKIYSKEDILDMQNTIVFETDPTDEGFNIVTIKPRKSPNAEKVEEPKKTIEPLDLDALEDRIHNNDPTLTRIMLRHKDITDDDVDFLCTPLRKNTIVTELDLSENAEITDKSIFAICKLIDNNKKLRRLYLDGTSIKEYDDIIESLSKNMYILDLAVSDFARREDLDMIERYLVRNENF
jgi:hypothetical protein